MRASFALVLPAIAVAAACGSGPLPGTQAPRASGQSALMGSTFAGQNACNPKQQDRPFIVEWDATDTASFESRASTDVIFVHYEACNLQVIDTCTNDSVRGAFGSYLPADWSSGSLEKIDIQNEGDLYAKLPLSIGSLGARVEAGEKFHMEYFVSGTRRATRPYVYRGEIQKIPGCHGVTHMVYAYNLGAFALESLSKIHGQAGATVWGVGAGGDSSSSRDAEKHGGDLAACRGASAHETSSCQTPIRLTLREIQEGENPDQVAAAAPETPDALNLAGKLQASDARGRAAGERLQAAQSKLLAGDGAGCLRELDEHDRLDAQPGALSTNPKNGNGYTRGVCLMASGQCDAGKAMVRQYFQATSAPGASAESVDLSVDNTVAQRCGGLDAKPRDRVLHAIAILSSYQTTSDVATCRSAFETIKRLGPSQKADDSNPNIREMWRTAYDSGPRCLARANDCAAAWTLAKDAAPLLAAHVSYAIDDEHLRDDFVSHTRDACLGRPEGRLTPREQLLRDIHELDFSRQAPADAATCEGLYAEGRALIVATPGGDKASQDMHRAAEQLRSAATRCLSRVQACASAWRAFGEMSRWLSARPITETSMRREFGSSVAQCRFAPEGALPPRERLAFVLYGLFREGQDASSCRAASAEAHRLLASLPDDKDDSDIREARFRLPDAVAACLVSAGDCSGARSAFHSEQRSRLEHDQQRVDDASIDRQFSSSHRKCAP